MNNSPKILLIEDNEGDVELTIEALQSNKIDSDITVINNGEDAINYLKQLPADKIKESLPNLILLDLNLPKIDGREVLKFIKNNVVLKSIPVVMLTTSSLQADIEYSYNHHANFYLVKSPNVDEFNESIHSLSKFWVNFLTYPNKNNDK